MLQGVAVVIQDPGLGLATADRQQAVPIVKVKTPRLAALDPCCVQEGLLSYAAVIVASALAASLGVLKDLGESGVGDPTKPAGGGVGEGARQEL